MSWFSSSKSSKSTRDRTTTKDTYSSKNVNQAERYTELPSVRRTVLDYTTEELEVIKEQNYLEYCDIMKKRMALEEENMKMLLREEEMKLRDEYMKHKEKLNVDQSLAKQQHKSRAMEIEAATEEKLDRLKRYGQVERKEHELAMKKSEQEHKRDMQDMKQKLVEQRRLKEMETEVLEEKIRAQQIASQKRKQEQDDSFAKLLNEQQHTFHEEEQDLVTEMDNDLEDFDKLMEEESAALADELDGMFEREIKITKPDGTVLEMREKRPGIVTKIAEKLFDS